MSMKLILAIAAVAGLLVVGPGCVALYDAWLTDMNDPAYMGNNDYDWDWRDDSSSDDSSRDDDSGSGDDDSGGDDTWQPPNDDPFDDDGDGSNVPLSA